MFKNLRVFSHRVYFIYVDYFKRLQTSFRILENNDCTYSVIEE